LVAAFHVPRAAAQLIPEIWRTILVHSRYVYSQAN